MAVNVAGQTLSGNSPQPTRPKRRFGHIVFDATAITTTDVVVVRRLHSQVFHVGERNRPRQRRVEEGMAADSCIKTVAAGTRTLEVTGGNHGITVCDSDGTANTSGRYVSISQNATLALILASKTCGWMAQG
jgi:hypothetical protein